MKFFTTKSIANVVVVVYCLFAIALFMKLIFPGPLKGISWAFLLAPLWVMLSTIYLMVLLALTSYLVTIGYAFVSGLKKEKAPSWQSFFKTKK